MRASSKQFYYVFTCILQVSDSWALVWENGNT